MDLLMTGNRGTQPGFWGIVFDAIPFPIYVVDIATHEIVYANQVMRDKTQANPGQKCYQAIYWEESPCTFCKIPELCQQTADGAEETVSELFNETDDRWYQIRENLIPWFDGRLAKYSIAVDITDLKQMQNDLAEAHATLTLKNQEVEEASRAKSVFLATMSHEIRTPMNGILGMAQLLLDSPLSPTQHEQMETLKTSGEALLTILNDVLDLSKLEAGRVEFEYIPFSLKQVLEGVAAHMRTPATNKGLFLTADIDPAIPPWLLGDAGRLRQILLNLLGNAVKFTETGGVTLQARQVGSGDGQVEIAFLVMDTGIGMDTKTHAGLFQPFSQANASISRRFGGTGLGLAICKRLVEAQGGSIGADSTPGEGSCFWFHLGFQPSEAPAGLNTAATTADLPPLSILLAEDNLVNQKVATALLSKAGHRVTVVGNGLLAVEAAAAGGIDLVLMDIQMPEMDGLTAMRAIRALPSPCGRVPIVALTANVMQGDAERYHDAGMNGYVSKPFTRAILLETISTVLAHRSERERLKSLSPPGPATSEEGVP